MSVITLRVDDSLLTQIDKKIKQYHQKRSDFIREAILSKLEDIEDLEAFEATKNDKTYSLAEVKKRLNVED